MTIEIDEHAGAIRNEFGVGVTVHTKITHPQAIPDGEGATWAGICMAINGYMRSRGAPTFDCLKRHTEQ